MQQLIIQEYPSACFPTFLELVLYATLSCSMGGGMSGHLGQEHMHGHCQNLHRAHQLHSNNNYDAIMPKGMEPDKVFAEQVNQMGNSHRHSIARPKWLGTFLWSHCRPPWGKQDVCTLLEFTTWTAWYIAILLMINHVPVHSSTSASFFVDWR